MNNLDFDLISSEELINQLTVRGYKVIDKGIEVIKALIKEKYNSDKDDSLFLFCKKHYYQIINSLNDGRFANSLGYGYEYSVYLNESKDLLIFFFPELGSYFKAEISYNSYDGFVLESDLIKVVPINKTITVYKEI